MEVVSLAAMSVLVKLCAFTQPIVSEADQQLYTAESRTHTAQVTFLHNI